jgi:hypothetical protein
MYLAEVMAITDVFQEFLDIFIQEIKKKNFFENWYSTNFKNFKLYVSGHLKNSNTHVFSRIHGHY